MSAFFILKTIYLYMFFHGSTHKINNFTDGFVGGKEAHDQEGPGIYFTSSSKNARSYGPYVYTVKLHPKKFVSTQDGKSASIKEIEWLIKQAPNWEMHAENFNENPNLGVKIASKNILEYNDNPHQQFLQVWIDFYRNNPVDYVRNMVKLGYDAVKIEGLESIIAGEGNITHIIVLNPAVIEFVEMEDDRSEEEKRMNEIRKFVRKTLNESVETNLNDNFLKWFAGSKVVDAAGNPMPVHHGTAKKFSKFNLKNALQKIIWFTSNKSAIEAGEVGAAGKGHIMDLYVSMKNPAGWDEYEKYGLGQLKGLGYDGAILPDPDGTFTGFVFEPTQLKSIKNKGEWNPNDKNIYKEGIPTTYDDDYDFSEHNFNMGDCDIYAVSLHRLYGYPLYVIRGHFLEEPWGGKREWDHEDAHIMVKLPNGNYLDSSGEQTEKQMKRLALFGNKVRKITFEPIDEETALSTFSCQNQEPVIKQVMKYIKSKKSS